MVLLIQDVQNLSLQLSNPLWHHQLSRSQVAILVVQIQIAHNHTGIIFKYYRLIHFRNVFLFVFRPSSTNPPQTYLPPDSQFVRQSRQIDATLLTDINNLVVPGSSDFHTIESDLLNNEEQTFKENDLLVRKKRSKNGEKEIISITLNFKGYQFS
jgi:hypothetical protein